MHPGPQSRCPHGADAPYYLHRRPDRPNPERRCKLCTREQGTRWRAKNRERILRYREKYRPQTAAYVREYRSILRTAVLAAYGGKCVCCGESEPIFLAVDHIDNGGAAHRRLGFKGGEAIYRLLRDQNFPKDNYQLLCHNCNWAKSRGGCPHGNRRL